MVEAAAAAAALTATMRVAQDQEEEVQEGCLVGMPCLTQSPPWTTEGRSQGGQQHRQQEQGWSHEREGEVSRTLARLLQLWWWISGARQRKAAGEAGPHEVTGSDRAEAGAVTLLEDALGASLHSSLADPPRSPTPHPKTTTPARSRTSLERLSALPPESLAKLCWALAALGVDGRSHPGLWPQIARLAPLAVSGQDMLTRAGVCGGGRGGGRGADAC